MNYELIHNITAADIAVRVKALTIDLMFRYGAEALMSEMVEDISSIKRIIPRTGNLEGKDISLLYFEFLNELLFFKDSENLLLLAETVEVSNSKGVYTCVYTLKGEEINSEIHNFRVDIKAVTLHGLQIYQHEGFFIAESVFDV